MRNLLPLPFKHSIGVTLVEVLIAIVIFGLASFPVITIFGQSSAATRRNNDYRNAVNRGTSILEGLMLLPFSSVARGSPVELPQTYEDPNPDAQDNTITVPESEWYDNTLFTYRLSITDVEQQTNTGMLEFKAQFDPGGSEIAVPIYRSFRRYDLTVFWQCVLTKEQRSIELTCYKADLL